MVDLVEFARTKDINTGIMALFAATTKMTPLLGTLVSICLEVFKAEINKIFEEWKKEDEENLLKHKTLGVIELDKQVRIYNQRKLNSGAVYALEPISYEVMEGLVTGKIKNIDMLEEFKQKYPAKFIDAIINGKYFRTSEVQMLYKWVVVEGENILFIDSFYTNK